MVRGETVQGAAEVFYRVIYRVYHISKIIDLSTAQSFVSREVDIGLRSQITKEK